MNDSKICPCTGFICTFCKNKPQKHEYDKLIKIYHMERLTLIFTNDQLGYYWRNVFFNHLYNISNFTTKEQLDNDLRNFLQMNFDEWYNTL